MSANGKNYRIELEVYEGPLDLLLHLVKKHELDVMDIPVAFVTEKYLEYLDLMRQLNLEVAGEYLLMAATLAHIKSYGLLPKPDPEQLDAELEDEGDPRQELIRRLLEYQKYKEAALSLDHRPVVGRNVFTRGAPASRVVSEDVERNPARALADVPVFALVEALNRVLEHARVRMSHEVIVDRLKVTDRINELVDRLTQETTFSFTSCFPFLARNEEISEAELKHLVVVTFLAVLEMAKMNLVRILQPDAHDEIYLVRVMAKNDEPSSVGAEW